MKSSEPTPPDNELHWDIYFLDPKRMSLPGFHGDGVGTLCLTVIHE